jgi:hypothetical protein
MTPYYGDHACDHCGLAHTLDATVITNYAGATRETRRSTHTCGRCSRPHTVSTLN